MTTLIRLKRKASDEPADGLVVTLKKVKCDTDGVLFKFAATLDGEEDSLEKHIKEKKLSPTWKNPKDHAINEDKIKKLREKLQAEHKNASEKKKLDYLNNKRLILNEEIHIFNQADHRQSYQLYDIIEENEDIKKQKVVEDCITCNNQPLIREKVAREKDDGYVYDVYIADGQVDKSFLEETLGVTPCTLTSDDIYFDDDDDEYEEYFEDEDDSNDENNWRNDYPDEMDSVKDNASDHESSFGEGEMDHDSFYGDSEINQDAILDAFKDFDLDGDNDDSEDEDFNNSYSKRVMKELINEYDLSD